MEKEAIVRGLEEVLRTNNAARHQMGIEGAVDAVSSQPDGPLEAVVFADKDGKNWAVAVLEEE